MGKRLTQLNEALAIEQGDYLLVDGDKKLESEKILLKNIKLTDFDDEGFVKEEDGKGLSTNDFTNEDKQKLDKAQSQLINGQNIKTLNGESILGEGNLEVQDENNKTIYIDSATDPRTLFDLETGIYTLYDSFQIYPDSTKTFTFTCFQRAYITKNKGTNTTYVQMPQPVDNKIHYLKIWKNEDASFNYKEEIIELANISLQNIDQSYNPESENAQSGKAVAEGLRTKADRNKIFDYITYEINNNQVTITGCDTSISGSHIIPNTIEGYPVTIIGMNAFENCTGITSMIIPKGITGLYPNAFYGCSNLTSIEIPSTVVDIAYNVFYGCTKLKEVSFNAKITSLYGSTFADCTSLTSIVIPNGVIDIDTDFYNCSSLKTITIPDSVTFIGNSAFYNCTSLTDIYYSGTQEQWNSIIIDESNDSLSNATIHYNQELATKEFVLNNSGSGSSTVDQTYNPESENPQSGKAVAEAIDNLATKGYVDNLIGNINSVLATIVDGVE